ncbi:MAG TPA: VOC family protein [Asanoa sp.]|nr:VOC family protein [Asanoa sp.]
MSDSTSVGPQACLRPPVPGSAEQRLASRFGARLLPRSGEPKTVKNRLHLDLTVSGGRAQPLAERRAVIEAEVHRLEAAGAHVFRLLDDPANDYFAVVMDDPEGNEFCVC